MFEDVKMCKLSNRWFATHLTQLSYLFYIHYTVKYLRLSCRRLVVTFLQLVICKYDRLDLLNQPCI